MWLKKKSMNIYWNVLNDMVAVALPRKIQLANFYDVPLKCDFHSGMFWVQYYLSYSD